MDTHAMDGAFLSQLTSAAMVVYLLQSLKKTRWYPRFAAALPIDDPHVHRIVSALGAFLSAVGVHVAFEGSAATGWHFVGTIPPVAVLMHAGWDWLQQFMLNQLTYDAVAQRAGSSLKGIELTTSSLPGAPAVSVTGQRGSARVSTLAIVAFMIAGGLLGPACGAGHVSPKVTIDVADRTAYNAARALQKAVEADYQAHQPWPSFTERRKINILLGGDPTCVPSSTVVCKKGIYDLVIDVANIGINLPPGAALTSEDLKVCGNLEQAVIDLTSIVSTKAAQTIQDKTTTLKETAGKLLASVKGVPQ